MRQTSPKKHDKTDLWIWDVTQKNFNSVHYWIIQDAKGKLLILVESVWRVRKCKKIRIRNHCRKRNAHIYKPTELHSFNNKMEQRNLNFLSATFSMFSKPSVTSVQIINPTNQTTNRITSVLYSYLKLEENLSNPSPRRGSWHVTHTRIECTNL